MNSGASFSEDRKYRFSLWRVWDDSKPLIHFVMLNPSTADETDNDPTVERCKRRAEQNGYGGLIVTNIFAYRSTEPKELKKCLDPIGFCNDSHIIDASRMAKDTICGWGKYGEYLDRGARVLDLLKFWGIKVKALRVNKGGTPAHPLYIGYDVKPRSL
jgi:hypothetical protein